MSATRKPLPLFPESATEPGDIPFDLPDAPAAANIASTAAPGPACAVMHPVDVDPFADFDGPTMAPEAPALTLPGFHQTLARLAPTPQIR